MNTKTYYHISLRKRSTGDIIRGRGKRPLEEKEVEEILEQRRPADCPDRGDSVYMRKERDFSTVGVTFDNGYVHTLEPLGKVDRRDLLWIGILQLRHHKDERLRKMAKHPDKYPGLSDFEIADRYWSGEATTDKPSWEWIAKEAKVTDVDSDLSPVRPSRWDGLLNQNKTSL